MNTGTGDAIDLAWQLAAVEQGWGGAALLDSYEAERKPVAWHNSVISANNTDRIDMVMSETPAEIAGSAPAREALRLRVLWMTKRFNSAGTPLGYRCADSLILVPDGTPEPPDDPAQVVPSTWPGSRFPHRWMTAGDSTLDLVDRAGFALLSGPGAAAPGLFAALREVGPWRGKADPATPHRIAARIRGAEEPA